MEDEITEDLIEDDVKGVIMADKNKQQGTFKKELRKVDIFSLALGAIISRMGCVSGGNRALLRFYHRTGHCEYQGNQIRRMVSDGRSTVSPRFCHFCSGRDTADAAGSFEPAAVFCGRKVRFFLCSGNHCLLRRTASSGLTVSRRRRKNTNFHTNRFF